MKKFCPIVDIDGAIEGGKQFDLDITLPEDNRDVIYGIVKDCYRNPVKDAVVKLVEVVCEHGKDIRKPVAHTFTDCEGEFVFGPLCPDRFYALDIFVNRSKQIKVCAKVDRDTDCLKGKKMDKCDCVVDSHKDCQYNKCDEKENCNNCNRCDDKCGNCNK